MYDAITRYTAGKKWYWYLPLWLLALYVFISAFGFNPNQPASPIVGILYTVQFGVHELAHLATAFLPSIVTASAGSVSELLLVGTCVGVAIFYRYYFVAALFLVWATLAFQSVGVYMADAQTQQLQLVSFGEKATHDWHFIFSQIGILAADTAIGTAFKTIGYILGLTGLAIGAWLIVKMMAQQKSDDLSGPLPVPGATQHRADTDPSAALAAAREAELDGHNKEP